MPAPVVAEASIGDAAGLVGVAAAAGHPDGHVYDDLGHAVVQTARTAPDGTYRFADLRPGTYTITETQPAGYKTGKDILGSLEAKVREDPGRELVHADDHGDVAPRGLLLRQREHLRA